MDIAQSAKEDFSDGKADYNSDEIASMESPEQSGLALSKRLYRVRMLTSPPASACT